LRSATACLQHLEEPDDYRTLSSGEETLIPLAVPNLKGNEAAYLQDCVDTNFVSSVGPFVDRFETQVAEASGGEFAVATSSGTTGLHAALTAVGVGRDDLVIMPSLTFIATANAVSHCGAMPWLTDVDEGSWTMSVPQLQQILSTQCLIDQDKVVCIRTGRRVGAILPVHTLGMPVDIDEIADTARRCGLPVVVDAAASLGSRYRGRAPSDCSAELSVYSFNGNKTVTAGGGGAVVGNSKSLLARVRHLTTTARVNDEYVHDEVGFNYRMTNIQAAVGCAQLEHLDEFVARKRAVSRRYAEAFEANDSISDFPSPEDRESACWLSGVLLDGALATKVREIRTRLKENGIDAKPFWRPIHKQQPYAPCPRTEMPVTDDIWQRILTLPCSTSITDDEQEKVIQVASSLFSGGSV